MINNNTTLIDTIQQHTQLIDIASRKVICLRPHDTVAQAARIMADKRISSVVITNSEQYPIGIITESNILQTMQSGKAPETLLIDIMSTPVITVPESMMCLDGYQVCLRNNIRHLVIVNEHQQLTGIITESDFRQHINLSVLAGRRQVSAVMSRSVFSLSKQAHLLDTLDLMYAHRDSCVVIIDDQKPIGIITERDIVRLYSNNHQAVNVTLNEVMTKPVKTIPISASINEAAEQMLAAKIRHLVVTDANGDLAGLLSEHDLTQTMTLRLIDDKLIQEGSFLSTLLNTLPDGIWQKDLQGFYLTGNPCFKQFYGIENLSLIGKTDYDIFDSDRAHAIRQHDQLALENSYTTVIEEWVTVDENVPPKLLEIRKIPMQDNQGMLIGLLGIVRDITEQKQHEELLKDYQRLLEKRLDEETSKFRALIEQSLVGNYIIQNGVFCYVNIGFAEIFGYASPEEIIGQYPLSIVDSESREIVSNYIKQRLNGEINYCRYSFNGRKRDGTLITVEVFGRLINYQGLPAIIGTLVDITETRRSQQQLEQLIEQKTTELRYKKESLRTLINAIPDPIFFKDIENRWLEANSVALQLFGLQNITWQGKNDDELLLIIPPEYSKLLSQFQQHENQSSLISESLYQTEHTIRLNDGQLLFFDVFKKELFNENRQLVGNVIIARNITTLKNSQNTLAESEELFRTIFEQSPIAIELIDPTNLQFIQANPVACQALGYSSEEYKQLKLTDIQADWDGTKVNGMIDQLEQKLFTRFENNHKTKNGEIINVEINSCLIHFSNKKVLVGLWQNITERKRIEQALQNSLKDYSELVQKIPVGVYKVKQLKNGTIHFNYVSPQWCKLLEISEKEIIENSQLFLDCIHADDLESFLCLKRESQQTLNTLFWEGRIVKRNKSIAWHHIEAHPTLLGNGNILWDGIQYDVTDRKLSEEQLRITASVFENSQEAIVITDANNSIINVNPAFTTITGYSHREVIGRNPRLLSSGRQDKRFYTSMWECLVKKKRWRGEIWNRRKSGDIFPELLSISAISDDDGHIQRYVGVFSDISFLKEYEAELSRIAHYDALTGIPNRVLLADRMKQAIAKSVREQSVIAICYLDLDGFKAINDTFGHEIGDQVLIEVAKRISLNLRGSDTVARLGGDEFVVLLELENKENCLTAVQRLLAAITPAIVIDNNPLTISASIGVSLYPFDDIDIDKLLRHADQAMYIAKQSGKNCCYIYDSELESRLHQHHLLLRSIQNALDNDQFELYYQPKINLKTKQLVGLEALIRWNHPERGLLAPDEFLYPVRNTDLDIKIGNWVIATVLKQINIWQNTRLAIEVSINISAYHLESSGFANFLIEQLKSYGNTIAKKLQIEILETVAIKDYSMVNKIIEACRQIGVGFALDDFGTGYSSLSYLSRLPVDVLKIDQSFVINMLESKEDRFIVQGIIALASAFERKVVAEGIETKEHYQVLLDMGCNVGQGYAIARPMQINDLEIWLDALLDDR